MLDSSSKQPTAVDKTTEALDLLRGEAQSHHNAADQKSYLARAVSFVTEPWHKSGEALNGVETLSTQIQSALAKGDKAGAARMAESANEAVAKDFKAMKSESTIGSYGTQLLNTVGLFMPGKAGYLLAGGTHAADAARPAESIGLQMLDGGMGLSKGLLLKGSFDYIGQRNLGLAAQAVSMGVTARLGDQALTRDTYLDHKTGEYGAWTGISKTLGDTFAPKALASDVITFGLAKGLLGKVNSASGGALESSPFWSRVATGGAFGVSSGSVAEIDRQQQAGENFDVSKVVTRALLTGATDMVAAGPGGAMARAQAARGTDTAPAATDKTPANTDATRTRSVEQNVGFTAPGRNFEGSNAREFQLVNNDTPVAELLRNARSQPIFTQVREVSPAGQLGPEKSLLVQHLSEDAPLNRGLANQADLIATCNPFLLPESIRMKHILPATQGGVWLSGNAGRIQFSAERPVASDLGSANSVELGTRSVSDLLLDPKASERLRDMHDLEAMGKAMQHFKLPAKEIIDGGADSVVIELANKDILKITDKPWNDAWGHRTYKSENGVFRLDARLMTKPQTIDLIDGPATYFIQERALSPVMPEAVRLFNSRIERDGTYKFWDNDFSDHGQRQLGYTTMQDGKRGLVLLDYDAVRLPHLVPKRQAGQNEKTWWAGRYRNSDIEWDR